jgi:hypothetical protein
LPENSSASSRSPSRVASNDAINEYNEGVKAYNAQIEKAKGN